MAVLELGIELNNIQIASKALEGLQKQLNGLGKNKINVSSPLVGSEWDKSKAKIEDARRALIEFNLEQKKLKVDNKPNLNAYQQLSRELTEMRNEAKSLGAQLILLEKAGMGNGVMANTLKNRFDAAQKEVVELDSSIKKLDGSLGMYQRNVGNYANKQANANGVAMEFNRIIQDAPFGMMGIGNNIQQLAANWQVYSEQAKKAAQESGKTISTMSLVKGALSSIASPANVLTLAVAAVTSAWTYYNMNVKKTVEATSEINNKFTSQLGVLRNVISLSEKSAKTERDKATAVSIYNKELGDTLGKVKTYAELEQNLIKNGSSYVKYLTLKVRAEAAYQASLKQTITLMEFAEKAQNMKSSGVSGWLANQLEPLANQLEKWAGNNPKAIGKKTIKLDELLNIVYLDENKYLKELSKFAQGARSIIEKARNLVKSENALTNMSTDLTIELNKLADAMNFSMPDLGLDKASKDSSDLAKNLEKVNNYLKLMQEIGSISGLDSVDYASIGKVGIDLEMAKTQAEFDRVLSEIQNFISTVLKDTTISEKQRTELIAKANLDREILQGKHNAKMIIIQEDYMKRLEKMTVAPIKIGSGMPLIEETKTPEWMKQSRDMVRAIRSEIEQVINKLPQMKANFTDIFNTITGGINDVLQKSLVNHLGELLEAKMRELDSSTKNIAGALAIAGNTLKGMFSQSSVAGQGIGGALSGAASGLAIGTSMGAKAGPWGAAIGAVLGGLSGIIGASKRKKEEERQRQQLEEQKKTNALLERMNALAYTSSIIGGKTTNGIVTGVNRNEFGEVTFRIEGRDLVASLGRQNTINGR